MYCALLLEINWLKGLECYDKDERQTCFTLNKSSTRIIHRILI